MKKVSLVIASLLMAISFVSNAQDNGNMTSASASPKLIAVVNSAKWCSVCRANGARFGAVLSSFAGQGVKIYMNDLSNDSTKALSKIALEEANVYEAVTTVRRNWMGKALKFCGLVNDNKNVEVSGIVTFINPETKQQVEQLSISVSDENMKETITNLLQ